ncbi:hydrophobin [Trichoderma cornu-damae]|uniref:Hydrophobin n=1 Tax=Trichoderma cornu-damae TaxID=654480 RepID=A0A9P8QSI8_9HYPO|nr:hydrophobin [Trichoderma cornu-damae]
MQFSAIIALFASLAVAAPAHDAADLADQQGPCPSGITHNIPKCCGSGLFGLLYLDCKTRNFSSHLPS